MSKMIFGEKEKSKRAKELFWLANRYIGFRITAMVYGEYELVETLRQLEKTAIDERWRLIREGSSMKV